MPNVLFQAAGSLRPAYDAVDWARTPLGPVESWNPTLRTALDLVLQTRFGVTLFWGPSFVLLYNEAYVDLIAEKHPSALGAPARDVFPEAWDTIGPMMEGVLAGRGATWVKDSPVPLRRSGFLEECYFTFSYSAVRDRDGAIEGVLNIAAETSEEVVGRRRLAVLARLADALADLAHPEDVPGCAAAVLAGAEEDLPAVEVRMAEARTRGADPRLPAAPATPLGTRDLVVQETAAGRVAWLSLHGRTAVADRPVMVALLSEHLAVDDGYLRFLRLVATSIAEALDRAGARSAERGISETLQRSLLTTPQAAADVRVAVRYLPAAQQAHVGGDWYDSFVLGDGSLALVIGDVAGHDRHAAAAMAQVRNVLRGIVHSLPGPPSRVLTKLDETMLGLGVDDFVTAVLALVEPPADGDGRGARVLRWSSAGHPPPVLLEPDGTARLLQAPADPLLGLGAGERSDHAATLEPGSAVVLYTDGLVERRGVPLARSLGWLTGALQGRQGLTAEALCDHIMARVERVQDDVALLVARLDAG